MPKKASKIILTTLFNDGVLVCKKDKNPRHNHPELGVPMLYVIQLMKSMKSRSYITENFCCHHFYWYLTNEGIEYLREYLHLPSEIVPLTLRKKQTQGGDRGGYGSRGGDRGGPRGKDGQPSGEFAPEFNQDNRGEGRGERRNYSGYGRGGRGQGQGQQHQDTQQTNEDQNTTEWDT